MVWCCGPVEALSAEEVSTIVGSKNDSPTVVMASDADTMKNDILDTSLATENGETTMQEAIHSGEGLVSGMCQQRSVVCAFILIVSNKWLTNKYSFDFFNHHS